MTHQEFIRLETKGHRDMHDITLAVTDVVERSGMREGLIHVFNVGSTGCVGTLEYEPGLERDLPEMLDQLLPPDPNYGHEQRWQDGNGHSHLQATLMGPSLTIPFADNTPILGTWQQIIHLECDIKPRTREIVVTVRGD